MGMSTMGAFDCARTTTCHTWTFPSFLLVFYETSYAESLDCVQVLDHAHPVLASIAPVQVLQSIARKAVTLKAELEMCCEQFCRSS